MTSLECEAAARQLGFSNTSVTDDGQSGVSHDPPYCYYEGGSLKFNSDGENTGSCSSTDKCFCIAPNPGRAFKKLTIGSSCQHIYTMEACEEAAKQLGLDDVSAEDDWQYGIDHDPPYCYYEDDTLKFNHYGRNTGQCTSSDQCICINGNYPGVN